MAQGPVLQGGAPRPETVAPRAVSASTPWLDAAGLAQPHRRAVGSRWLPRPCSHLPHATSPLCAPSQLSQGSKRFFKNSYSCPVDEKIYICDLSLKVVRPPGSLPCGSFWLGPRPAPGASTRLGPRGSGHCPAGFHHLPRREGGGEGPVFASDGVGDRGLWFLRRWGGAVSLLGAVCVSPWPTAHEHGSPVPISCWHPLQAPLSPPPAPGCPLWPPSPSRSCSRVQSGSARPSLLSAVSCLDSTSLLCPPGPLGLSLVAGSLLCLRLVAVSLFLRCGAKGPGSSPAPALPMPSCQAADPRGTGAISTP